MNFRRFWKKLRSFLRAIWNPQKSKEEKARIAQKFYWKGNSFYTYGRYKEAINAFDKSLTMKPDDSLVWLYRGIALFNLGHYEESIVSIDKTLILEADNYEAFNNKGLALHSLRRYA